MFTEGVKGKRCVRDIATAPVPGHAIFKQLESDA
jgi:hypothetical protein